MPEATHITALQPSRKPSQITNRTETLSHTLQLETVPMMSGLRRRALIGSCVLAMFPNLACKHDRISGTNSLGASPTPAFQPLIAKRTSRALEIERDVGCVLLAHDGRSWTAVRHVGAKQLGISPRRGVLHLATVDISESAAISCLTMKGDEIDGLIKSAARALGTEAAGPFTTRDTAIKSVGRLAAEEAGVHKWIRAELFEHSFPETGPNLNILQLSVAGGNPPPCNLASTYELTSNGSQTCQARFMISASDSWVAVSMAEIDWWRKSQPVQSLQSVIPVWQTTLAQHCRWLNDVYIAMMWDAQSFEQDAQDEEAALDLELATGRACERAFETSVLEFCFDTWIRERILGWANANGAGDGRPADPNALRKQSRVQVNIDPEGGRLSVYVNSSDVFLLGWTRSFEPDGGRLWQTNKPDSAVGPGELQWARYRKPDPNTMIVDLQAKNNVPRSSIALNPIRVHAVYEKFGGQWRLNTQLSWSTLFPYKQFNYRPAGQNSFLEQVTLPALLPPRRGLTTYATLAYQMRAAAERMMSESTGTCAPM